MTEEIENKEGSQRVYEVGYLLLPSIPEERLSENSDAIKKMISDVSGTIISQGDPQFRNLSYEMVKTIGTRNEKFRTAYFGWIKFETDAENIAPLQEKLKMTDAILRFLLIKTVREDTLSSFARAEEMAVESDGEDVSAPESEADTVAPDEEIDKSIDELVA
jgi:ribosomal protein S6